MNKVKIIIISVIFTSIFLCCSKQSKVSENTVDLDSTVPVSVYDLFESVDVIQLETNDECVIGPNIEVFFYKNRYYIFDFKQQGMFCFDDSGGYLFKIFRKGQGPEEYLYLGSCNIDHYNDRLMLLEPFGNLLLFDLDGNFISKIKLPMEIVAYNEVFPLNKDTLLFISLNKYTLVFYDLKTNTIIDKKFEDEIKYNLLAPTHKTYIFNNEVFFSIPFSNNIMNINTGSVFTWNFGNKNISKKQIQKVTKEIMIEPNRIPPRDFVQERLINYQICLNYETPRYRICLLKFADEVFKHVFFDKMLNKAFVFNQTKEGVRFLIPFFNEKFLIVTEEPNYKYKYYDENILTEQQREIINRHDEYDNPILVRYNFKQYFN